MAGVVIGAGLAGLAGHRCNTELPAPCLCMSSSSLQCDGGWVLTSSASPALTDIGNSKSWRGNSFLLIEYFPPQEEGRKLIHTRCLLDSRCFVQAVSQGSHHIPVTTFILLITETQGGKTLGNSTDRIHTQVF